MDEDVVGWLQYVGDLLGFFGVEMVEYCVDGDIECQIDYDLLGEVQFGFIYVLLFLIFVEVGSCFNGRVVFDR